MIALDQVTMRYPVPKRYREILVHPWRERRRVLALHAIDLRIAEGDCLGVLGPNGAGKTTLLKLIGGILYPSAGRVLVDGLDTTRHNLHARRKVGYVINEERSFFWRLSGIRNLGFFGVLDNLSGEYLRQRIAMLLSQVGLEDAGEKRVCDYSSGMKQRLAIARGLLADPDVLLLDEPTKSLDPIGARDLRRLLSLEVQADRSRTLVVATNQIADVVGLCDRLCVIANARIVGSMPLSGAGESAVAEFYRRVVEEK